MLVVNYWASWCAPCVEEMPAFSRLQRQYAAQGVQFVGIGIDDCGQHAAFVNSRPVTYPLLVADAGRSARCLACRSRACPIRW
jgi:thiol-disulfide isomerase/thioredoxin